MNEKILIIDDERNILESLEYMLTKKGFRVRSASEGGEAIDLFKSEFFDLVITDIRMPVMDGFEVMRRVRLLDKDVKIIVLTGCGTPDTTLCALEKYGAFDFLTKPLEDVNQLFISIEKALAARWRYKKKEHILKFNMIGENMRQEILMTA